ncbi:CPBP family intramembrane metalloprotease [Aestuariivirga litoralis]|uniref:CPBP family intramembrane metalloprotease n=1 Tax=Aestuariivirga litoralis TaxID=2650924 RepID=A0A2W2BRA4_9HYPH|nr:CPBP family intramembrane glutamic endopeptidase [Aestuariivirga litoralis]PZF78287.1 CPBP family intramembrane metalloprotease [Aestuariivirga litoralis]
MEQALSTPPIWLRVLQFPLTRLIVLGGIVFYMMAWTEGKIIAFKDSPLTGVAIAVAMAVAIMVFYAAWGKVIERREVTELSLPGAGREFAIGALVGTALYTACVLLLMVLGMYKIEGLNPLSIMIPGIAMAVKSAVFEELVFRGILFGSVEAMAGSWIAIIISSLVFGFIHLLNPSATIGGAVYICIEAGLLFSAAYMVTRRLWMAMGLHMLWNYVQSGVFSGIVSGGVMMPGLFKTQVEGPDFVTGGSFGMEESLGALIFCTGAGIVMLLIAMRRGHMLPPPWKRKG